MSTYLIALCAGCYLWVSIDLHKTDPWVALTFLGYALGNVGLLMKALGR